MSVFKGNVVVLVLLLVPSPYLIDYLMIMLYYL